MPAPIPNLRAGPLRHRLAIQLNAPTRNAIGEAIPGWATVATVWGRVESLAGRELEVARQVNAQASIKITLRFPGSLLGASGLTPRHRLAYTPGNATGGGAPVRYFDINNVTNVDERNRLITCTCTESA